MYVKGIEQMNRFVGRLLNAIMYWLYRLFAAETNIFTYIKTYFIYYY